MQTYTAHVTPRDGVTRRIALISFDLADARLEAQQIGRWLFGRGFTYSVRAAA